MGSPLARRTVLDVSSADKVKKTISGRYEDDVADGPLLVGLMSRWFDNS